ncbi:MAG: flagellar motor switch phosphatase FliY [Candidatus Gastranaerophilales bacterium]|nr:flagellar motor switch phosphatase FliY [Candidatus Gastranaerophilales bacterium]
MAEPKENKPLEYLTEQEADALGELCNISMGAAATTLSTLLNNKVEITTPTVMEFKQIEDIFQAPSKFVTVEINYIQGIKGTSLFSLKPEDTAIIADLMMGGSGKLAENTTTEVSELQLSAVGEAMNQMMGASSTSLSSIFNFSVNISPPVVKLQNTEDEKLELTQEVFDTPIIAVAFNFQVGELINSTMVQILPLAAAQKLINTLMSAMSGIAEEISSEVKSEQAPAVLEAVTAAPVAKQKVATPPPPPQPPITVQPVQFTSFDEVPAIGGENNRNLDLLMDIKLKLTVELGRTELPIKKVLDLTRGSVIELNKIAGEPVELFANGKQIARGEVVVIEDNFGLRITSIISPDNRIKNI